MPEQIARRAPDFSNWSCPLPLAGYPTIVMGHGGGGKLGNELVEHLFLPAFRNPALENLGDAAVLDLGAGTLAMSTDSFVVQPLFFPGGSIGELAVNGTVNDLAVSGAMPRSLAPASSSKKDFRSPSLPPSSIPWPRPRPPPACRSSPATPRSSSAATATAATSTPPASASCAPAFKWVRIARKPGDAVLVSGTIGDHGMAIMSVREGLEFESQIRSDCAALNGLIAEVLDAAGNAVHAMRDPTRGGLASTLNEIAQSSGVGIAIDEASLPVRPQVQSACELLGLDPVYVANEGKAVFFVAPEAADRFWQFLRAHPLGSDAARIGHVTAEHKRMLVARTAMGANRVIPTQIGEQLPRIC